MSKNIILVLIYHRHKILNLIYEITLLSVCPSSFITARQWLGKSVPEAMNAYGLCRIKCSICSERKVGDSSFESVLFIYGLFYDAVSRDI
jgi:hypothetical protein